MANEWSKLKIDTTDLKPELFAQPIVESPNIGIPSHEKGKKTASGKKK